MIPNSGEMIPKNVVMDNVDINSLRINYKSAYYMRAVRQEQKTEAEAGTINPIEKFANWVIPNEKQPEKLLTLRQYASNLKGRAATEGIPSVAQEFFDYLTNPVADMMNIQIDILGDPGYLTQDNFVPINDVRLPEYEQEWNTKFNSYNSDRYQPIINLKYRLPADVNEKKGFMFSRESKDIDENLFFSGAYQVYKVDSRFERGAFTQTLHCVRLNNQQGTGAPAVLVSSASKEVSQITETPVKKNNNWGGMFDDVVVPDVKERVEEVITNKKNTVYKGIKKKIR